MLFLHPSTKTRCLHVFLDVNIFFPKRVKLKKIFLYGITGIKCQVFTKFPFKKNKHSRIIEGESWFKLYYKVSFFLTFSLLRICISFCLFFQYFLYRKLTSLGLFSWFCLLEDFLFSFINFTEFINFC